MYVRMYVCMCMYMYMEVVLSRNPAASKHAHQAITFKEVGTARRAHLFPFGARTSYVGSDSQLRSQHRENVRKLKAPGRTATTARAIKHQTALQ